MKHSQNITCKRVNKFAKLISGILAAVMIVLPNLNTFAASKNAHKSSASSSHISKSLKDKFAKFQADHPKIANKLQFASIFLGALGIECSLIAIYRGIQLLDMKTVADKMSKSELQNSLDDAIDKFNNREGGDAFKVNDELIKHVDKKVAFLIVSTANTILDTYSDVARYIAEINRNRNIKFQLNLIPKDELKSNGNTYAYAYGFRGVFFNGPEFSNYNSLRLEIKSQVKTGFYSRNLDPSKLIQSVVSHEFGHVIETWMRYVNFRPSDKIKSEIIDRCTLKYRNFIDFEISGYGKKDSDEWFAETFADTMCGKTETALTKTMKEFIQEKVNSVSQSENNLSLVS